MTPELAELIQQTFRGVYSLTWQTREELDGKGEGTVFDRAVASALIAQDETMEPDKSETQA